MERKIVTAPLPFIFGSLRVTCHKTTFAKKKSGSPRYPCRPKKISIARQEKVAQGRKNAAGRYPCRFTGNQLIGHASDQSKMGMEEVARAEQSLGRQPLVLLPSLCFGAPFSLQPDGKQVFITPAGKLVCPHGELSSTISYWLASEKKARLEGLPIPPRGGSRGRSSCDCQSTEGLNVKPDASTAPPPPPASLFQFLEEAGAELTTVKGREARRIPHVPGPMFVTTLGKLCCRHGASRASLSKRQRCSEPSSRRPACQCVLKPLPARAGIKGLQLGKCAPCKAVLQVVRSQ